MIAARAFNLSYLRFTGRRVYAIAYRSCKIMRTDKVFQDKVYITLGREGRDWVVTEIKTTR